MISFPGLDVPTALATRIPAIWPNRAWAAILGLAAMMACSAVAAQTLFDKQQVGEIEQIVDSYLERNPEIVLRAFEELQRRRELARSLETTRRLGIYRDQLERDPASAVAGNPEGDVTIVEFFDYRCPYCKQDLPILAKLLKEDPGIRIVYKEFPILGPDSVLAARAAIAARKQGKYLPFHQALMKTRGVFTEDVILQVAIEAGLNPETLLRDMGDPAIPRIIRNNRAMATALDITGTPSFVIGNTLIPGYAEIRVLKKAVAKARAE